MNNICTAAQLLFQHRQNRTQTDRLTEDCRPQDLEQALLIQEAVSRLYAEQGELIGGWKCLLPTEDTIVVAPVYKSGVQSGSHCELTALNAQAAIEPELAFVFGQALPPRITPYSEQEVYAAITEVRMALELIRGRYLSPNECSFAELLADGLFNQGLYLGPVVTNSPAAFQIELSYDQEQTQFDGKHPNGDARVSLVWLVNYLNTRGYGIEAGQAVITGSYAGVFNVPFTRVMLQYAGVGQMQVTLQQRP